MRELQKNFVIYIVQNVLLFEQNGIFTLIQSLGVENI